MIKPSFLRLLVRVILAGLIVLIWVNAASYQSPRHSDATHEWLQLKAAASGVSPFEDLVVLAEKFDVPYSGPLTGITSAKVVAYRTPGALLLMSPLLLVRWPEAHALVNVVGVFAFLWLVLGLIPRFCNKHVEELAVPLALGVYSVSFREATRWGSMLVAIAVLTTLVLLKPVRTGSGPPLAIAAVLKLFPSMLLVPLLIRRGGGHRVVWAAMGTGLALTVGGSLVFGISLFEALQVLDRGSGPWLLYEYNLSLGSLLARATGTTWLSLVTTLAGVSAVAIFSLHRPLAQSLAFSLGMAILVSPVSWISYGVLLIPLVAWLWANHREYPLGRYVAGAWLLIDAFAIRASESISDSFARTSIIAGRVLLTMAVALAPAHLWRQDVESETDLRIR